MTKFKKKVKSSFITTYVCGVVNGIRFLNVPITS